MQKTTLEKTENTKKEYWAITKDGTRREKLTLEQAEEAKRLGKATFWYMYIDGVRKIESFDLPCDVYEKEIVTITNWKKL